MITHKMLFNASVVIGILSIILLVITIAINEPVLVLCNVAILAVSILCALVNYKAQP